MADSEFFTIEDKGGQVTPKEYSNHEEALGYAEKMVSDHLGQLTVVRWTRTEVTRLWREISVKSEDMSKAMPADSKTP